MTNVASKPRKPIKYLVAYCLEMYAAIECKRAAVMSSIPPMSGPHGKYFVAYDLAKDDYAICRQLDPKHILDPRIQAAGPFDTYWDAHKAMLQLRHKRTAGRLISAWNN